MPSLIETARWAAAVRAKESERPDRLFSDPLAAALAGEEGLRALRLSERHNPRHEETANYLSIRIRLFDEVAQDNAARGIRQIVLPAAGMDARAYRLSWPEGTTFYELDQPELVATKERILEGQSVTRKGKRVALGADLREEWAPLLLDSGFAAAERSMWLIEGLFYYLEEPAVNHVLGEVSRLAAPGSALVADLVSQSLLTSPWMQPVLKAMEERGMAWRFGTDDPVGLFAKHGWKAAVKQPGEEGARFNAQRFANRSRRLGLGGFFVVARRA